ncbi:hypothetical protein [Cohnella candidum]|uniref:Uncharacterized protein n=1 Tax=Cohnella candidum TaxID=2674991 RepID=A0A3G3K3P6_9BACL|nr:hypothetical protein [Cohnella candidum]AYQ75000.1 hypothetical protein EAV92_22045 [Cohnella candidum]
MNVKPLITKAWIWSSFLLILATALAAPPAWAASPDFTDSQKKEYERTLAAADDTWGPKLKQQHLDYVALKQSALEWEQKVSDLHYRSEEKLTTLRKRIQQIDADKLAKLKADAEQTKSRHQKLFDLYRSANQQLAAARKVKNKTLTALFQAQSDAYKIPVQLARQEIKNKDAAYQQARKATSAKMKKIRDELSAVSPLQVQIRALKSALKAPKDSQSTVWRSFTQSLSKRDAKLSAGLLGSVNTATRQIVEQHRKMYELEGRIAEVIRKAEGMLV